LKDLPDLYERRLKACSKLEKAETAYLEAATKAYAKREKRKAEGKSVPDEDDIDTAVVDTEKGAGASHRPIRKLVPDKKRPSHRLPAGFLPFALPFIGKKVDTIDWCRKEIRETTEELERRRAVLRVDLEEHESRQRGGRLSGVLGLAKGVGLKTHRSDSSGDLVVDDGPNRKGAATTAPATNAKRSTSTDPSTSHPDVDTDADADPESLSHESYPPLNSAFILFHQQIAAHLAAQSLTHNEPYRMASKYTEVAPTDVLWGNLGMNPYEMQIRRAISYGLTVALIVLWAIPVAFIGTVSNLAYLCETAGWLAWICRLPKTVVGIIQGILPPAALAILMMMLPIVLRMLAKFEGVPRKTSVELSLMTRYFAFQVIVSCLARFFCIYTLEILTICAQISSTPSSSSPSPPGSSPPSPGSSKTPHPSPACSPPPSPKPPTSSSPTSRSPVSPAPRPGSSKRSRWCCTT
jgi:hypothetical protein